MRIRLADKKDMAFLLQYDSHIAARELENVVKQGRVYVAEDQKGALIGWLRYNLFWDNTPFMNMLYILEDKRGQGTGSQLVECWENDMCGLGYPKVMTSTASDEYAQHFYVRLGYRAVGGFTLPDEPYELIFVKCLFVKNK